MDEQEQDKYKDAQEFYFLDLLITYLVTCERELEIGHKRSMNPLLKKIGIVPSSELYIFLDRWQKSEKNAQRRRANEKIRLDDLEFLKAYRAKRGRENGVIKATCKT